MQLPPNPTLVILGRPNVGKSTLFNRLSAGAGGPQGLGSSAIVHPTAGTTRDVRRTPGQLFGLQFTLLDTAGLEFGPIASNSHAGHRRLGQHGQPAANQQPLQLQLNDLALNAAKQAHLVLLVIDGAAGVLPADRALAQHIRKLNKPVLAVLNKSDLKTAASHLDAIATLGFGAPICVSSAHNAGFDDLHAALQPLIPATPELAPMPTELPSNADDAASAELDPTADPDALHKFRPLPSGPLHLAVLGRPNVGKSTLVNALLGQEVMLTGPTAGLTREAISHPFTYAQNEYQLIDTPGLRKQGRIAATSENLEFLSVGQSLQAVARADVILLVVDASIHNLSTGQWQVLEQQDAQLAQMALRQFKPLIVALNKWDEVKNKTACLADVATQLHHKLHAVHTPLALPVSARNSKGLHNLMQAVQQVHQLSYATFSTNKLNNLLARTLAKRSPPLANGQAVTLKFIRQTDVNPPSFTFWGNRIEQVSDSYKQFLRHQLAEALGLSHIAVKIHFRSNKNPFAHKANPRAPGQHGSKTKITAAKGHAPKQSGRKKAASPKRRK